MPLLAGEADEVGDDQEVAGVAHRDDHAELVVEPRLELRRHARRSGATSPRSHSLRSQLSTVSPSGTGKCGMRELAERQLDVGHLGDPAGVAGAPRAGPGRAPPSRPRASGRSRVVSNFMRPGRVEVVAGADAQQHVVGLGLGLVDVVEVVRRRRAAGRSPARGAAAARSARRCSGRPWSWSSRKKLSGPKMSPYSPASRRADVPVVGLERARRSRR